MNTRKLILKIIQIEDFFHPNAGYQINILSKIWAQKGHEVHIFTAMPKFANKNLKDFFDFNDMAQKDRLFENRYNVKIHRKDAWGTLSNRVLFKSKIIKDIAYLNPDILYIHGNDTYIGILIALKIKKINRPIIMDSHMQLIASRNRFRKLFCLLYKKIITPKIINNEIYVIKTVDTNFVNIRYGIPMSLTPFLGFGSDISLFKPDQKSRKSFNLSHKLDDNTRVFIYAGKLELSKGIDILINAIKNRFDFDNNVAFVIIGNIDEKAPIANLMKKIDNKFLWFPTQSYEDLAFFFQVADVFIFPRENSLTFFDAQAAGLPCILDNSSLNIKRVSHNNGDTFKAGDSADLRETIVKYINMDLDQLNKQKKDANKYISSKFNYQIIADLYLDFINKTILKYRNSI